MSGGPDPLYIRARTALLDAADALAEQLDALVLVGAQAIYLHTCLADFAVAEYTTDADFCVAPAVLTDAPLPPQLLEARGFVPGAWSSPRPPRQESRKASQGAGRSARRPEAHDDLIARFRSRPIHCDAGRRAGGVARGQDPQDR